ncbi:hypothetical protein MLD38_022005 [Melastoma candidum]|uniref:Uncharacterized protein n=1 Tax=Melastoma candidum TaxID=119954 RepID=A0ACB9QKS8_9MYRT|nr:hypothetical protein MLD38_022005 [Melastoma candidum]
MTSRAATGTTEQRDEEEEEEEEEEYYESLDRLMSSSSCSCSNSEDECEEQGFGASSSSSSIRPVTVFRYDIWTSVTSSVSERRSRLLCEMGLDSSAVSRGRHGLDPGMGDFGQSGSSDWLAGFGDIGDQGDGSRRSDSMRSVCFPSGLTSIHSIGSGAGSDCNVRGSSSIGCSVNSRNNFDNGAAFMLGSVHHTQSTSRSCGNMDEIRGEAMAVDGNCVDRLTDEGEVEDAGVCRIKNLDDGKEFVVNEFREDGTWNKLKEVETGRQLTFEEFEISVGHSPIVQELMRRQNFEEGKKEESDANGGQAGGIASKMKKRDSWFRSFKSVASSVTGAHKERRSSDERDTSSERGGRRSSSATDDSQDASHGPEKVKVRQYGKSSKELSALYKTQEIQAHGGSIWAIKFSLDGKFLASAGEDCIIHVWKVVESERKGELLLEKPEDGNLSIRLGVNGSPELSTMSPVRDSFEKKRRGRASISRKSLSLDHILIPDMVFALSDKPLFSFEGHDQDVLDLSWAKSQHLLSSSMDKTVRLWHMSSKSCLKIFRHSDYVTCIQFNPVEDKFFISGSLDGKVRIWSVPDGQVVDWSDFNEMVTAACYKPDGRGALVGSYKGTCRLYDTSENKLVQRSQINLQNRKKKSHLKKITGFQFVSGSSSEVVITSADSRIRVVDGTNLVHKFKGFRNTNSQISASLTANGRYVVSASEDSHVYVWKHEVDSRTGRSKGLTVSRSFEQFHSQDVSIAMPWPGFDDSWGLQDSFDTDDSYPLSGDVSTAYHPTTPVEEANDNINRSGSASGCSNSPLSGTISSANNYLFDRITPNWTDDKLNTPPRNRSSIRLDIDLTAGMTENMSAWGLVIVTAGLRGEIRIFQNFGLPI